MGWRGAETPDRGFAGDGRRGEILETHTVKDVLAGRQVLDQRLGGEVRCGRSIDVRGAMNGLETIGGRKFDQQARRPVGTRPYHS